MPTNTAELAVRETSPKTTGERMAGGASKSGRFSWWLWPHLLSLDAPLVAVVWQCWWARSARVELPGHAAWILGLGVWMIYLADRLADTSPAVQEIPPTLRHAFHARWRWVLWPLTLLAAGALTFMTPVLLTRDVLLKGLALLSCAVGYFWLIHNRRFRAWQVYVPKEAIVGGMFALGTVFFSWCHHGLDQPAAGLAVALFGGLCACNCALITRWESNAQDLADPVSLLNAYPFATDRFGQISLALASLAGVLWMVGRAKVFLPVVGSGVALAYLDHVRHRASVPALRVLADAALLTPVIWLLF